MSITIREAMQLPDMVHTRLVAGESGLNHPIHWVTIVEIVEDLERLQAGEFLITTGFGLEMNTDKHDQFIPSLAARGLSGVAIHTGFYLREIPALFIEQANQFGLPLIEIPTELNFSTITKAILQPIVNRQFELIRYSEQIHQRLLNVALLGEGLSAIADELAAVTQGEVVITDVLGYELIRTCSRTCRPTTAGMPSVEYSNQVFSNQNCEPTSPDPVELTHSIEAARFTFGTITLRKLQTNQQEWDIIALQHASTLAALACSKDREVAQAEWRLKGDFLDELLSGTFKLNAESEARSRLLGYPLHIHARHLVVALSIPVTTYTEEYDFTMLQKLPTLLKRVAEVYQPTYLSKVRATDILLLMPEDRASEIFVQKVAAKWLDLYPQHPLAIGISTPRASFNTLSIAVQEAIYAMKCRGALLPASEIQSVSNFDRLSGYQFLFPYHAQPEALQQLWEPLLVTLLQYDQKHGQQLLETIQTYFEEYLNGQKTAQRLFIHRHTLKYRLQQIEEKTAGSLYDASHRWQLQLAIMAYHLQQILYPDLHDIP
ncbi:PucR family transcriptional regulator [Brevibacillus laterosporus]|uniref:PucR family transcriptional regulator n=1 Tax=Brevibacillus laterosporus TaxID=1465 RepID=UPI001EF2297C|nr:PucR family transcriptional regulator ligand-binding domain-containing protein [Brevibacillus laterosporus]MCG7317146.1 PucR family transcriptional regulator ligand-binding domain-containing protein [Brevibacillus laterosporus]